MKILILKPSSLGDIVHAIPVLRLLRLNYPESEIYWWIDNRFANILNDDRDLNGLLIFDRNNWKKLSWFKTFFSNLTFSRSKKFDLIIDLQGLLRSGLFGWLCSGCIYLGLDQGREGAAAFYDIAVPRSISRAHAVDWYVEVLKYLKMQIHFNFDWLPEDKNAQNSIFSRWQLNKRRYITICPGARWETKRLPHDYYIEIIKRIIDLEKEPDIVVIGGQESCEIGEKIKSIAGGRCVNAVNQTTIKEMIEVIRFADFFMSNDTGPLHIAAALKKPLLSFFGPTDPKRTGPYGFREGILQVNIPCAPCFKRKCNNTIKHECLKRLTPDIIFEKYLEIKSKPAVYKYTAD